MWLLSASKGHHGVKRASNYHPFMLKMTIRTEHQWVINEAFLLLLVKNYASFSVHWKFVFSCSRVSSSNFSSSSTVGLGRWTRGPPRFQHIEHFTTTVSAFCGNSRCTTCACNIMQWWPLICPWGVLDVPHVPGQRLVLLIHNESCSFIPHRWYIQNTFAWCCAFGSVFDLKSSQRQWQILEVYLSDTAARFQSLVTTINPCFACGPSDHKAARSVVPLWARTSAVR